MVQISETAHLHEQVREPAQTVDTVPGLQHNFFLSVNKFAETNYLMVFMQAEVHIFDGECAQIKHKGTDPLMVSGPHERDVENPNTPHTTSTQYAHQSQRT